MYFAGIYARLSVDGGGRKNESIDTQIEIAREYIRGQSDMILYDCYTDLGRTGTNFERRGFERLMEDVRFRRVNCVIVKDFSRFGRNYIETGNYLQKIFPFLGVRFIAVTDGYDSLLDKGDEIGVNLKNLANEMYTRDIAVKVKSSKRAKWAAGSYTGGIPPYGYLAEWDGGRKRLLKETETAEIVREIFRLYGGGKSLRETAEWLYREQIHRPAEYHRYGHPRRQDGETLLEWSRTSVKTVLTNPVYMGCLAQKAAGDGGSLLLRPEDLDSGEWLVKADAHEAIVSGEQFFAVAGRFGRKRGGEEVLADRDLKEKDSAGKAYAEKSFSGKGPFGKPGDPFEGILFCGICGKKLGRRPCPGRVGFQYFCRNSARIDSLRCGCGSITGETLDGLVREAVRREFALADIRPGRLAEECARCAAGRKASLEREAGAIRGKIRRAEKECGERYLKYREGILSREEFLDGKSLSQREFGGLRRELEALKREERETEAAAVRQEIFLEKLSEPGGEWTPDRELIKTLIQSIRLHPGKGVEIFFRFGEGPGRVALKRRGKSRGQEA